MLLLIIPRSHFMPSYYFINSEYFFSGVWGRWVIPRLLSGYFQICAWASLLLVTRGPCSASPGRTKPGILPGKAGAQPPEYLRKKLIRPRTAFLEEENLPLKLLCRCQFKKQFAIPEIKFYCLFTLTDLTGTTLTTELKFS